MAMNDLVVVRLLQNPLGQEAPFGHRGRHRPGQRRPSIAVPLSLGVRDDRRNTSALAAGPAAHPRGILRRHRQRPEHRLFDGPTVLRCTRASTGVGVGGRVRPRHRLARWRSPTTALSLLLVAERSVTARDGAVTWERVAVGRDGHVGHPRRSRRQLVGLSTLASARRRTSEGRSAGREGAAGEFRQQSAGGGRTCWGSLRRPGCRQVGAQAATRRRACAGCQEKIRTD